MIQPPLISRAGRSKSASRKPRPRNIFFALVSTSGSFSVSCLACASRYSGHDTFPARSSSCSRFSRRGNSSTRPVATSSTVSSPSASALLRQMAHHRPFVALHRAGVRLPLLEDDGEQRGLARAVRPDQRDAVAIIDVQRRVLKQSPPAKGYLKITNGEHEKAYSPTTYRHHLERSLNNSAEAEAGSLSIAARLERIAPIPVASMDHLGRISLSSASFEIISQRDASTS